MMFTCSDRVPGRGDLGILGQEHVRPPLPHHQDHVDPGQQGDLPGPAGHQRGLPPGLAGRGAGDQAGVLAQQQQELGLLRPAHLLRLERGGSEPVGHFLHWHDLHRLGPGDRSGDYSFWFVLYWPDFSDAISVFFYLKKNLSILSQFLSLW